MARPQETFNKKELEKKRLQKRQEKEQRKEERKANAGGKSFEDMLAYVDENGNISSTPPDQTRKKSIIKAEDIVIGSRNLGSTNSIGEQKTGTVAFFNTSKGFGFIKDSQSGESIFVHMNALSSPIKENDKVSFEVERGPKGLSAAKVSLIR
jgi:cold shock CspA family protein